MRWEMSVSVSLVVECKLDMISIYSYIVILWFFTCQFWCLEYMNFAQKG
jgi:hypothetical protein